MKQVIVFPRGQLTKLDKERMSKAGIVAVEADDPSKVVTVTALPPLLSGDDIAMAAMWGVKNEINGKDHFFAELHRRMQDRENKR